MEGFMARSLVVMVAVCCMALAACSDGGGDGADGKKDAAIADALADGGADVAVDTRADTTVDGKVPDKDIPGADVEEKDVADPDVLEKDVEPVELPPDTTPPTVKIIGPKDGAFVSGVETVVVEAEDDREMDKVELYVDGELLATLIAEPYEHDWDVTQLVPGNYLLSAIANDKVGLSDDDSVVVFVQGECDENGDCPPKSVKVVTPVDGSTVCGEVTIEAAATDDVGIAEMEFFVDGDSLGVDVESPFQKDWDTADNEKGEHVVKVLARDTAGYEAFATVVVNVDNSGGACDNLPNVSIDFPDDGAYVDGVVEIVAKASDDIGVLKVQFFIDNALVSEDNTVPYKVEWDTSEFDEGAHTIKTIAYDTADQMGLLQIQVTVDRTPPELNLLSPGAGIPYHDVVPFEADATDNFKVDRVEFLIDGDDPIVLSEAPYTMDLDATEWASGTYDFEAVAFDGADHTDSMAAQFLLDRPPVVSISAPDDGATMYGNVEIEAQVEDDLGIQDVVLYADGEWADTLQSAGGGKYECAWYAPYLKEDHVLQVVAIDLAGQEALDQIELSVDYPVTVELLLCDEWNWCDPVEPDTEVTGTVYFAAEAEDDGSAIASVEFLVDGNLEHVDEDEPFEFEWDSSLVTDGAHTLKAIAVNELAETAQTSAGIIVNNCDLDGDGYLALTCAGTDCDDGDADFNPGELDTVGNEIDENCDGIDGADADGDGYASEQSGGDDCNDTVGGIHPCADDLAGDGEDSNCDNADQLSCDDCNSCTMDTETQGVCTHQSLADGSLCEDGNLCTEGEACNAGQCLDGAQIDCDDINSCTADSCDVTQGCVHSSEEMNGLACGNGGTCSNGSCCVADCYNKECGDDGCGGGCGVCPCQGCAPDAIECVAAKCVDPNLLTCLGISECLTLCGSNQSCQQNCMNQGSIEAQQQMNDYLSCLMDNGWAQCGDQQCVTDISLEHCWDEYGNCYPSGELDCSEMYDCMEACPQVGQACPTACYYEGTLDAKAQYQAFFSCVAEQCGDPIFQWCFDAAQEGACAEGFENCLGPG